MVARFLISLSISDLKLPILRTLFEEGNRHLPLSLIANKLIYEEHRVPESDFCAMMCLFEERKCQFYSTTTTKTGSNCFLGRITREYGTDKARPNLLTAESVATNFRLDQASNNINFTEGMLSAFGLKSRYSRRNKLGWIGSCNGSGIHVVDQYDWVLDFNLNPSEKWNWQCIFVIIKAFVGKIRMSIPDFNVNMI